MHKLYPKVESSIKATNVEKCDFVSLYKSTYWSGDKEKVPDLISFFIMKGISNSYLEVDNIDDLTLDYVWMIMRISATVIRKRKRQVFINKFTDWDKFREELDGLIDLKVKLKITNELDVQAQNLTNAMHRVDKISTPTPKNTMVQETYYPLEIREMISKRRKAQRIWQLCRNPSDKNAFNRINN